jgi:hypothetical protein
MDKGNKMIPYHKDCGEDLSVEQKDNIDKLQRSEWSSE